MPDLAPWGRFYAIVGSAGAALVGIQFVVITLIAALRRRTDANTVSAFATPTVVHLAAALVVSAVMSAPWPSLRAASVMATLCGVAGLTYVAIVVRRARIQTDYRPAYAALAWAALRLPASTHASLFVIGAAALGLLLAEIHNAWDTVTHLVLTRGEEDGRKER